MATILVINAKAGLVLATQTALQSANHETIIASSASDAITLLDTVQPTLILLGDTHQSMREAIATLKAHPQTRGVPIILQSDQLVVHNLEYQQLLGATAVIESPFSARRLVSDIAHWIQPA